MTRSMLVSNSIFCAWLFNFICNSWFCIDCCNESVKIFSRNDSVAESEELERKLDLEVKELVVNKLITR